VIKHTSPYHIQHKTYNISFLLGILYSTLAPCVWRRVGKYLLHHANFPVVRARLGGNPDEKSLSLTSCQEIHCITYSGGISKCNAGCSRLRSCCGTYLKRFLSTIYCDHQLITLISVRSYSHKIYLRNLNRKSFEMTYVYKSDFLTVAIRSNFNLITYVHKLVDE